jgi:Protein of unknown function (DUF2924)
MVKRTAPDGGESFIGADIAGLSRSDLAQRWEAIYGSPPPRSIKRLLLERAVTWHLQAKLYGGLPAKTKRQLAVIVVGGGGVSTNGASTGEGGHQPVEGQSRSLTPGTRLVREWRGRTHVVEVLRDGFRWNSEEHASLSAIARKITGARWSGPRFFGL